MRILGTHTLLHPIELETLRAGEAEPVVEVLKPAGFCVTLRRPKAKDMLVFDRHGDSLVAATSDMIERISNLDSIMVANLDAEDFEELGNLLGKNKRSGPATGPTPSADLPPPLPSNPAS